MRPRETAQGDNEIIMVTRAMLEAELLNAVCVTCHKPVRLEALIRTTSDDQGGLVVRHLRCNSRHESGRPRKARRHDALRGVLSLYGIGL